ncbi:MAG: hypothetical protein Q9191_001790 [Dirinaria sp. TL-2023a]
MAPSQDRKLVQTQLPEAFRKISKGFRVEKSKAHVNKSSQLARSRKERPVAAISTAGPVLVDGGEETIGDGAHQAVCSVRVLQTESSAFFEGPIKEVTKTKEAADKYRSDAAEYPVVRDSTVVKCQDGRPLLYIIKGGMFAGLSADEQQHLSMQSTKAIQDLVEAYEPPAPTASDPRARQDREEQSAKWKARGKPWGRYYGTGQRGVRPPVISTHSKPQRKEGVQSVADYMRATAWEHTQVARWLSVIDSERHLELHSRYQGLGQEELKHLYQGEHACHSGLAFLVNLSVEPHKDSNDAKDSWTSTNVWGEFRGGHVVFPDLGLRVAQEPGDLILSHAAIPTHLVEDVEDGERFCNVRFTKEDILRPPPSKPDLAIPCPVAGCARLCRSWSALAKHIRGPPGKLRDKASKGHYHLLDRQEAREKMVQARAAYNADSTGLQEAPSA